jgi:pantoate--beta-alanine ligase
MVLFKKSEDLSKWIETQRTLTPSGQFFSMGFVPTMGALHQGHISLIEASKTENNVTVCSIFVNPTQFNDPKDFEKYPVTIETDIEKLEAAGCDVLFLPAVSEIYPQGTRPSKQYELGFLETVLDGKFRPGHFQGVCQVVERLLQIVKPTQLFLGQKDYQQCMVISKLIDLMGWSNKLKINICPTLREADGLAMSSRNMRLTNDERIKAVAIYQCLNHLKENIKPGNLQYLKEAAFKKLEQEGFKPDYISIADAYSLKEIVNWDGHQKPVALIAAFLNEVRLIDNMVLG